MSMRDVETLVQRYVRQALLAVKQQSPSGTHPHEDCKCSADQGRRLKADGEKRKHSQLNSEVINSRILCIDYGEHGYLRGDQRSQTPSSFIKNQRIERTDRHKGTPGSNFRSEKDISVGPAWVRVSEDPVTGSEQNDARFYEHMCDLYHTFKSPHLSIGIWEAFGPAQN